MKVRLVLIKYHKNKYVLTIIQKVTEEFSKGICLEKFFGFCKPFRKTTKGLGFGLELKISKRERDIFYTLFRYEVFKVTNISFSSNVLTINPSPETQKVFNEAITKSFTLL